MQTKEMPFTGEKNAEQIGLDGKTVLAEKPDPLVIERAKDYAIVLDEIGQLKKRADARYASLQNAFKKSKRQRKVSITTEFGSWEFWAEEKWSIKKKLIAAVK